MTGPRCLGPRATAVLALASVALGGVSIAGGEAAAQETPVAAAPSPTTGGWGAVDVSGRPATTVVAVTLVFPRGSADDPSDAPGAAWLVAHVAREMALAGLDPAARAATEIAVDVDRSRTAFRMVTLPRYWEEAYGVLEWAVLRAEPTEQAVARVRGEMQEVFRFEADAPHREFQAELYRLLGGGDSPWSRPPRGTAEWVADVGTSSAAGLRDRLFRKSEGVATVLGAVDGAEAARTVTTGPDLPGGGVTAPDFVPTSERAGDTEAWESGERFEITREVTSTWVGIAYPVDGETPTTALDMLVHRLDGEFNSRPPDPGAFRVDVGVIFRGDRRLLLIEAAVLPEAADSWESRIRSAVEAISDDELEAPYFRAYRRRFRAARLLTDAPPEVEGLRRALDLLETGRVRALAREISDLVADDLQEAADDLGEPRILVLGPDISEGASW